ncbi:MAG: T9SS type A sorting domain-containing protein [Bacteroidota bacterium]|nr:T9SS type A sorting domain-containing protein [Bacteroidota bacterium]
MKKIFLLAAVFLIAVSVASAQYVYDSTFTKNAADSLLIVSGNGLHGVAVDPTGNVWTVNYNTYLKGDSITDPSTNVTKAFLRLNIWKPDGTPVSFSPLKILSGAGVTDTLYKGNSGRGLSTTPDGNILFCWFNNIYLLNYKTGAVIKKIVATYTNGTTAAAADLLGDIFVGPVFNNQGPLQMFDNTGAKLANVTDTTRFFSRTLTCSRAGDKVYYAGYTSHSIIRYTGDPLGGFTTIDTLLKGFDCEAIARSGKSDLIWASAGSGNDLPNRYGNLKTSYSSHTWYLWNPTTNAIKDSIKWNGLNSFTTADSAALRPRGVSTSTNGDTVYVVMFGAKAGMYNIQRFVGPKTSSVQREDGIVATNYTLAQNYPNPFNPSTKIKFTLANSASVSLKVYDVLGKEVATLATGNYTAGAYSVDFDAKNLAAGMYIYTLTTSNGFSQTKKMLLLK